MEDWFGDIGAVNIFGVVTGGLGAAFAAKQAVTLKHENEITSNDFYAKAKEKQILTLIKGCKLNSLEGMIGDRIAYSNLYDNMINKNIIREAFIQLEHVDVLEKDIITKDKLTKFLQDKVVQEDLTCYHVNVDSLYDLLKNYKYNPLTAIPLNIGKHNAPKPQTNKKNAPKPQSIAKHNAPKPQTNKHNAPKRHSTLNKNAHKKVKTNTIKVKSKSKNQA